ncbi:MAG: DUF885 domain-containing protein [Gammaproteobacteria bacterium]|nr:DUF885 domain-containing protein [Gammaproteobacteria bacterium]
MQTRNSLYAPFVLALAGLFACTPDRQDEEDTTPPDPQADTAAADEQVTEVVEAWFEDNLELNPLNATFIGDHRFDDRLANDIGPEYLQKFRALEEKYLAEIRQIDPADLEGQQLLSREIFERDRMDAIESFQYPGELIPINQFFSMPNLFAMLGSGTSVQPFKTVEDYENFLGRADGFVVWMKQARTNMREGMKQGIVQPRVVMEKTLPQLAAHAVENPEDSIFYRPIAEMPDTFSDEDRQRLTETYAAAIENQIVPAYRMMHDFIRDEYLPAARDTVGLSDLPNGREWYAYLVETTTTTDLTPAEIHQIGLDEVARIHGEMRKVMEQVGFEGDLPAFFEFLDTDDQFYFDDKEALLSGYRSLRDDVETKTLEIFNAMPKADFEIRPVEPFREQSAAGGSYMAATPDGSRPGVFYVNTYDMSARPKWAMESLYLHEAVPGHHFQISIQRELEELPRFRRFGGYTAYSEGWGLYAESLGKEIGVYEDPYQYFGALAAELFRSIRLVVDTGLHAKGWTREQVLDYMYENTAINEARAVSETERYIAIPGQALAYKIGELKIAELRQRAEEELGEDFDVKEFHAQVLGTGALPLDVLEAKINRWINSEQRVADAGVPLG